MFPSQSTLALVASKSAVKSAVICVIWPGHIRTEVKTLQAFSQAATLKLSDVTARAKLLQNYLCYECSCNKLQDGL